MGPRLDVAHALGGMTSRADAWQFIRDFAADWATPIGDWDGFSDETLDEAEQTLGVRLPAAVREAYRLFGRRKDLTSSHGRLLAPDELRYDRDAEVLVFRTAHQAVAYFGVSIADASVSDPPTLLAGCSTV
jgi:cell wall assembly regulator SMI1